MIFLKPYFEILFAAAWSLQQILEGLGLRSSSFTEVNEHQHIVASYWSPGQATIELLGMMLAPFAILCSLFVFAGYILGGLKGTLLTILILLLPGLLSLLSVWPELAVVPTDYVVGGGGKLSTITGFIVIVALALTCGWSLNIISSDYFRLGEKYRNIFDHFWYLLAISSGIFFVVESSDKQYESEIAYQESIVNSSSIFLIDQLDRYYLDADCKKEGLVNETCSWSQRVKEKLYDYTLRDLGSYYTRSGPDSIEDFFGGNNGLTSIIRREIAQYNAKKCPIEDLGGGSKSFRNVDSSCIRTPSELCREYPPELDGAIEKNLMITPLALATECVLPNLIQGKKRLQTLEEKAAKQGGNPYVKWMIFVLLSFLVGVKISNTTVKLVNSTEHDNSPPRTHQILNFLRRLFNYPFLKLFILIRKSE
ncbi:hypothetical protein [Rheinheimera sp. EpRS3]|uniref:hypothetical protein n=1 Tax=Rheinheimera sp. EpRS3 TaxID=1712383 RepID=UPI00074AA46E|nr:hypothetical protein [Rheinheimera sp. EpRS3]KUM52206.1 hypothetical protein AR688_02565 [Rheinheimera sp. EpRS3]